LKKCVLLSITQLDGGQLY